MRDRIRGLADPPRDDFDRAVLALLDDHERLLAQTEAPIPQSYLQRDGLPIVICECGKRWCIDSTGERAHRAYAKHWREAHSMEA